MNLENLKESFGTLSETINALLAYGYTHNFNVKEDCIICHGTEISLSPEEFKIDKVYRFDGDSDPEYQSVLYLISSLDNNIKGTLVDGYGISFDSFSSSIIEKLQTHTGEGN
ncbi:MAG: phosphoribosylpyrophosphate synthetase [Flavobacteriaceae bacterium]|nr:phosphoribosylpyrophosphate synthetase [Flavobacteriaceae bacterium]